VAAPSAFDIRPVLDRIRGGDRAAFEIVVRHYQRPLFGFLGRMGLSQAQAEDVAQEALLRAWRSLASFDPARAGFSTWLFTIARNAALNECDRAHARHETAFGDDEPAETASEQPLPCEALEASQRRAWLRAALCRLPASDRTLIALAYTHELQLGDIARVEGVTLAAIKTRLHRARQRLEQFLTEDSHATRS